MIGGLEGGEAVAFASGMAACAAVMGALPDGGQLLLGDDCYLGVAGVAEAGARDHGWRVERLPVADERWARARRDRRHGLARVALEPAARGGRRRADLRGAAAKRSDAGGRQHLRHAAPAASARAGRGRGRALGHEVHRRPLRPAPRRGGGPRRRRGRTAPGDAWPDRCHTGRARSLPRAPRSADAAAAPAAGLGHGRRAGGAARCPSGRRARPLPGLRRGGELRAGRRRRGRPGLPEDADHPPRHEPRRRGHEHGAPRHARRPGARPAEPDPHERAAASTWTTSGPTSSRRCDRSGRLARQRGQPEARAPRAPAPRSRSARATGGCPRSARRPRAAGARRGPRPRRSGRAASPPPAPPRARPRPRTRGRGRPARSSVSARSSTAGAGAPAVALGGLLQLALERPPVAALRLELEPVARAPRRPAPRPPRARARRARAAGARAPGEPPRSAAATKRVDLGAQLLPLRGGEEARARGVAERQPRAGQRPLGRHALGLQRRGDPGRGQRLEAHELAARDHRVEHAAERLGEQDQVHERAPAPRASSAAGWPPRRSWCPRARARTPGASASNGVRVAALTTGPSTSSTRITCAPLGRTQVRSGCVPDATRWRTDSGSSEPSGEQLGREGARRGALAGAGGAVEEVGVRGRARERGGEHHPRLRVVLGAGEDGDAHARAPLRAASTAASTSACTSWAGAAGVDPPPAPRVRVGQPVVGLRHGALELEALVLEAVEHARRAPRRRPGRARAGTSGRGADPRWRSGSRARPPPPPARGRRPGRPASCRGSGPRSRPCRSRAPAGSPRPPARRARRRRGAPRRAGPARAPRPSRGRARARRAPSRPARARATASAPSASHEQPRLRGLPRAVDSLEGDEQAAHRGDRSRGRC